jgi:hypothetical protein
MPKTQREPIRFLARQQLSAEPEVHLGREFSNMPIDEADHIDQQSKMIVSIIPGERIEGRMDRRDAHKERRSGASLGVRSGLRHRLQSEQSHNQDRGTRYCGCGERRLSGIIIWMLRG